MPTARNVTALSQMEQSARARGARSQVVEVVAQTLPDHPGERTAVAPSGGLRPRGG